MRNEKNNINEKEHKYLKLLKSNWFQFSGPIVTLTIVFLMVMFYFSQIEVYVRDMIMTNIYELAAHDEKTVEGHIRRTWSDLENISERLQLYNCDNIDELEEYIALEEVSSNLDALYLVDENGSIYTDIVLSINTDDKRFNKFFQDNPDALFVVWDKDITTLPVQQKSVLLYGVAITPFQVDNVTFTGIVGQAKITDIREQLQTESFNGNGNSRIVDNQGNYIVTPEQFLESDSYENIWDVLESDEMLVIDDNLQDIMQRFSEGEEFVINCQSADDSNLVYVFQPMAIAGVSGWYFITRITEDVFQEQSRTLLTMNVIQLLIVCCMLILLVTMLFVSRNATIRAKATAAARTELLSNMSHEIRTPINGIIGLIHQISAHLDDQKRTKEYLKKLSYTSEYLLSLVNDILDMSKLQAGKFELEEDTVCLEELVSAVCSMQYDNINHRGLKFNVETDFKEKYIIGDDLRIKQVLMNLLSNAAKFTQSGGTITIKAYQNEALEGKVQTTFEVIDNGCGISKKFQKHIFESFSQERNKITSSQKGTGLGLAISYLIMQQMGGSLSVESELDKGSCFTMIMPAKIAEPSPKQVQDASDEEFNSVIPSLKVLVAEDNNLNAEILLEILEDAGHKANYACDGVQAVKMFEQSDLYEYDLILMDVQMPNMNGYEAAKAIRALNREDAKKVLIFACTANTFTEDKNRAFESEMNDFLPKPIDIELMLEKLRNLRK